jgi:hypothetical protein
MILAGRRAIEAANFKARPQPGAEKGGEWPMHIIRRNALPCADFPPASCQLAVLFIEAIADLEFDFENKPATWPPEVAGLFAAKKSGVTNWSHPISEVICEHPASTVWNRYPAVDPDSKPRLVAISGGAPTKPRRKRREETC